MRHEDVNIELDPHLLSLFLDRQITAIACPLPAWMATTSVKAPTSWPLTFGLRLYRSHSTSRFKGWSTSNQWQALRYCLASSKLPRVPVGIFENSGMLLIWRALILRLMLFRLTTSSVLRSVFSFSFSCVLWFSPLSKQVVYGPVSFKIHKHSNPCPFECRILLFPFHWALLLSLLFNTLNFQRYINLKLAKLKPITFV